MRKDVVFAYILNCLFLIYAIVMKSTMNVVEIEFAVFYSYFIAGFYLVYAIYILLKGDD